MEQQENKCVICFEALGDEPLSTDMLLKLVIEKDKQQREERKAQMKQLIDCGLAAVLAVEAALSAPEEGEEEVPNASPAESPELKEKEEKEEEEEDKTKYYRAVGKREACRKQHLFCKTCIVDFLLNPTNETCPVCRGPLDDAVQMCHSWIVERKRAKFMCSQQEELRSLTEMYVEELRERYVDDIERAAKTAVQHIRYKLWPETKRDVYIVEMENHGDHIAWNYTSELSRMQRQSQIPCDREENSTSEVRRLIDPTSITLNHRDWKNLCHDLFGFRVEPLPPKRVGVGAKRKRYVCPDCEIAHADSESETEEGEIKNNDEEKDGVTLALEQFAEKCDEFVDEVHYNSRSPDRSEMIRIMRRNAS